MRTPKTIKRLRTSKCSLLDNVQQIMTSTEIVAGKCFSGKLIATKLYQGVAKSKYCSNVNKGIKATQSVM